MKVKNILRSLLVGAGFEAVLVALLQSIVTALKVAPMHPVPLLGILTQLPGVLLVIPLTFLESGLSERAVDELERIEICVVIVAQSIFFAILHYRYVKHRSRVAE